ncbi:WD repeat-containing protein [Zostera marina]|uniref:methylated diphthine methylhydrolase n=1 Tax=Zostera marina TaxID=29655 RepID=A0A0K9P960_ZOSMR|nr:WD repeat-containing protein [Zostera marina]
MDIADYKLDGRADVVEFCPHHPYHNVLAAATYTLHEGDKPHRSGSISLFSACSVTGLQLLQVVQTMGIFDMKWNPNERLLNPMLAQVDSDGCLSLYSLKSNEATEACGGAMLKPVGSENISSAMCLCLDWSPSSTSISLGLSDGSVSMATLAESEIHVSQSWKAHDYEVWSTLIDYHQPQLLYTGSDDCRFCCWDLRDTPPNSVFRNTKSHKMGVCCIAKNPSNPNMVLTGSYDESLRVWDVRSVSKPVDECSINLGGGVWRIKYHPDNPDLVLAACMHNDFAIIRIGKNDDITVIEKYKKHESLAYGADWQRSCRDRNESSCLVATCSFYDNTMRIWIPQNLSPA